MQLSAPNLPLDSNALPPAGAASAAAAIGATGAPTPAGAFGELLNAESAPPPPAGTATAVPFSLGPCFAAPAALDSGETDPTEATSGENTAPAPDCAEPNPEAPAGWFAAGEFFPPVPATPASAPLPPQAAPVTLPAALVPTEDADAGVSRTDDAATTSETPAGESANGAARVGEGTSTPRRPSAAFTRYSGNQVRGSQVRAAYARPTMPGAEAARVPAADADAAPRSPDSPVENAIEASPEAESENPVSLTPAGATAPAVPADTAANGLALAASIEPRSQLSRPAPAADARNSEDSSSAPPAAAQNFFSPRSASSSAKMPPQSGAVSSFANTAPQPGVATAAVTTQAAPFSLPATATVPPPQPGGTAQPDATVTGLPTDEQTPANVGKPDSAPPTAERTPASSPDFSKSGVTLVGFSVTSNDAREKIAAVPEHLDAMPALIEKFGIKKSLDSDKQNVAEERAGLGINVAKSRDAMPALAVSPVRPPTDDSPSSSFSIPSLDFTSIVKEQPPQPPSELASAARRTVESVLAVTDHFTTTGGQHGVNLKFSVSGVDLDVRVEVKGGSVQTTFRTDSPELRAALATEWRAVAKESEDRSERLAAPVFASSSGRESLQSDAGSADQRSPRQGQPVFGEMPAPRTALRRPVTVTTVVAPTPLASISTAGRLHTFA